MKLRTHTLPCLLAALLPLAAVCPMTLSAAPTPPSAKPESQPAVSVFVLPDNVAEGRDPFFPSSQRAYESSPTRQARGPSLSELSLKSILGADPRYFAIINNHTFAAGDEGDVITKTGQRIHIHCVDVNPRAGTATVEANDLTQVLHLTGEP
jgi:hypothetical protein